jgi:ketosteroid isomerase-like protein
MVFTTLTAEEVRGEVSRYWNVLSSKDARTLAEFYAHESSVFATGATRLEPGRLTATRREREYFGPKTTMRISLGDVEVLLLGDHAAVASYTFQMQASNVASASVRGGEEDIRNGRATQVFAMQPDGRLRIVHEHLSVTAGK